MYALQRPLAQGAQEVCMEDSVGLEEEQRTERIHQLIHVLKSSPMGWEGDDMLVDDLRMEMRGASQSIIQVASFQVADIKYKP